MYFRRKHTSKKQHYILKVARNEFHLKTLEAIYILSLKLDLCKQKKIVFLTILFNSLNLN